MPEIKYKVKLTAEEVALLREITHNGSKNTAKTILHAHILLKTNESNEEMKRNNREIAEIFEVSPTTVNQVRKLYATEGIESALNRKTRLAPPHISKITGNFEAQLIATALSPVPKGRAKWTLSLLQNIGWKRII